MVFLGGGYIDEQRVYYTYAIMPDDGYRLVTVKASCTTIYESNEVKPHIEFMADAGDYSGDYNYVLKVISGRLWDVKIWVPKGTIVKEFGPL